MRGKSSFSFGNTGDTEKQATPKEAGLCNTIKESKLKFTTVLYLLLGMLIGYMLSTMLRQFLHPAISPRLAKFQIEALVEAAKGNFSNHYSKLDNRTVALKLQQEVRVLCVVMTWQGNHLTQAYPIRLTWGKRCTKTIFVSDKANPRLATIPLSSVRGWNRTKEVLRYIHYNHLDEADWFFIVDDTTYAVMENLRLLLYPYSPHMSICFGSKLDNNDISGASGFVISPQAVGQIVESGLEGLRLCSRVGTSEYAALGKCLRNVGVLQGDARDSRGNERFYPLKATDHVARKNGLAFTSDRAISFRTLIGMEIYKYEYLIYHTRPYGIVRLLEELPPKIPIGEHGEYANTV